MLYLIKPTALILRFDTLVVVYSIVSLNNRCIIHTKLSQMDIEDLYRQQVTRWLHTIDKFNERQTDLFPQFIKSLLKKTSMNIVSDSAIVPIIIGKVSQLNNDKCSLVTSSANNQMLNDLLLVVKSLYENLFINRQDVFLIMRKINLNLAHIEKFIYSNINPISQRWSYCIPFRINIFWFIIPNKGIDRSLQILLYDKIKDCPELAKDQQIKSYIMNLKKKGQLQSTVQQSNLQSHYPRDQNNNVNKNQQSFSKWLVELSQIKHNDQNDHSFSV